MSASLSEQIPGDRRLPAWALAAVAFFAGAAAAALLSAWVIDLPDRILIPMPVPASPATNHEGLDA